MYIRIYVYIYIYMHAHIYIYICIWTTLPNMHQNTQHVATMCRRRAPGRKVIGFAMLSRTAKCIQAVVFSNWKGLSIHDNLTTI